MLDLSNVSLLLINGLGDPRGAALLQSLTDKIKFGEVFHLSPFDSGCPGYWIPIPHISGYYNCCIMWSKLFSEIGSLPWLMGIEMDGYPIHPELWDNTFFEWDYIGAPWPSAWPWTNGFRVGNGGCSLRSRKFIQAMRSARQIRLGEAGDVYMCCAPDVRKVAEDAGCRYAPVDVAIKFSFETPIEEFPDWDRDKSFGFHKSERILTPI